MDLDFEKPVADLEKRVTELRKLNQRPGGHFQSELAQLERDLQVRRQELYATLTPWQTVQVARHPERPVIRDYLKHMCAEFIELHGDRRFGDDPGIIGGFAMLGDTRVVLIGHQKGKSVEENVHSNFGMANPEGYRKAMRLMRLAEKYGLPVVSLIDTPGAYPGLEAEARGQAEAIARNLFEMATLQSPVVVVVTGEGGSGGAIGIGVGDVVMMLAHAVYSVISPEGCASILWRDGSMAPQAAEALKITSKSLQELGIIDEIIPEPPGGAHRDHARTFQNVRDALLRHIRELQRVSIRKLVERRYEKYARIGRSGK